MNKVSELLAKPIISIFDAKIVGTIGNIYFDKKMTKGMILSLFDDESSDAEEKFVELSKVVSIESDAAVIKDSSYVTYGWNTRIGAVNPINSPAFSQDGKLLGNVRDIYMDGVKIVSFIVGNREIAADTLLSHSPSALVFNDSGKHIKTPPKKKIPKPKVHQKIELHYGVSDKASTTDIANPIKKTDPIAKTNIKAEESHTQSISNTSGDQNKTETKSTIDNATLVKKNLQEKSTIKQEAQNSKNNIIPTVRNGSVISTTATQENETAKIVPQRDNSADTKRAVAKAQNQDVANNDEQSAKKNSHKSTVMIDSQPIVASSEIAVSLPHKIPQSSTTVSRTPPKSDDVDNKFDFLLGKLLIKNLFDDAGKLLIPANTLITSELIKLCKTNNRLVQLALHSYSPD